MKTRTDALLDGYFKTMRPTYTKLARSFFDDGLMCLEVYQDATRECFLEIGQQGANSAARGVDISDLLQSAWEKSRMASEVEAVTEDTLPRTPDEFADALIAAARFGLEVAYRATIPVVGLGDSDALPTEGE